MTKSEAISSWLKTHQIHLCPKGHAIGLSQIEELTGMLAISRSVKWTSADMFRVAKAKKSRGKIDAS